MNKNINRILSFVLTFVIVFCPLTTFAANNDEKSKYSSTSSILMCIDTNDILYEKNAHARLSPASVTKIMSILLILEALDSGKINLSDMVSASPTAVSKGGSQIWLEVGEQMTVDELLKAVVVASANDACTALGEYIAGSDSGFVKMMNDRVRSLGLKDTAFENCTGLDDNIKNHYSSAYDLAVIASEVMKHKIVLDYTTIWLDSLRNGKTELNNTNKLVKSYNGITGLKTGTTTKAGFCLCATACREGMNLVSVVLGAKSSADRFDESTELLDNGFANYSVVVPQIEKAKISDVKVNCGTIKSVIPVVSKTDKVLVKKGSTDIKYQYVSKKKVSAPIKKGDNLGSVIVTCDGKELAKIMLIAPENVKKVSFSYVFFKLLHII